MIVIEDCVSSQVIRRQMELQNVEPSGGVIVNYEVGAVKMQSCDGYSLYQRNKTALPSGNIIHEKTWKPKHETERTLKYVSLSGCYQITDAGLR